MSVFNVPVVIGVCVVMPVFIEDDPEEDGKVVIEV